MPGLSLYPHFRIFVLSRSADRLDGPLDLKDLGRSICIGYHSDCLSDRADTVRVILDLDLTGFPWHNWLFRFFRNGAATARANFCDLQWHVPCIGKFKNADTIASLFDHSIIYRLCLELYFCGFVLSGNPQRQKPDK